LTTLLDRINEHQIIENPFPHVVIENALQSSIYKTLSSTFPSPEMCTKGDRNKPNSRIDLPLSDALISEQLNNTWKRFLHDHSNQDFKDTLFNLFGSHVNHCYPNFEKDFDLFDELDVISQPNTLIKKNQIKLSVNFGMNTPSYGKPSSVRRIHIDNPKKIFAGLFYMPEDDDSTKGGDLELFKFNKEIVLDGRSVDPFYAKSFKTIPYKSNTLVMFINSPHSLHGVSPRYPTRFCRRFLYLTGEMSKRLFDNTLYQENIFQTCKRHISTSLFPTS
jgi:hypothetical protein